MSYLEMAADVEKYITDHGLNKPSLIGHSMGGKTVMTLLQNFDVTLGQAVILDIAPVTYRHDHDHLLHAMQGLDLESLKSRSDANQALSGNIPEHGIRQFLLQNLERSETGFRWRINLQAIAVNRGEIFGYPGGDVVIAPIHFIGGDRSEYLISGYYPELKSHFPNARIQHIANAGHWLHAEQPEALLDLLTLHLE
jgi:pimeloyl-ACP methyl ester carboxylesterase